MSKKKKSKDPAKERTWRPQVGHQPARLNAVKHGVFSETVFPGEEKEAKRLQRSIQRDLGLEGSLQKRIGRELVINRLEFDRCLELGAGLSGPNQPPAAKRRVGEKLWPNRNCL